ncbi:MAG: OmpH family outer membrane protein [Pontixanthobacter sp.]
MKILIKSMISAGLILSGPVAHAATATAPGTTIATSSEEAVFVQSKARVAAYEQINQTYAAQITQVSTLRREASTMTESLDTNKDGDVSQAEVDANPALVKQIGDKQDQADLVSRPIALAQYYVIEQLLNDYGNARKQVIDAKKIQIMLTPDAFLYMADGVDVTNDILAVVDQRLPTVSAFPPENYRPRQDTAQMHQAVQQIIIGLVQREAAKRAAEAPAAPAGETPAAPSGR